MHPMLYQLSITGTNDLHQLPLLYTACSQSSRSQFQRKPYSKLPLLQTDSIATVQA